MNTLWVWLALALSGVQQPPEPPKGVMAELLGGIDQCVSFARNPAGAKSRWLAQGWVDNANVPGLPAQLYNNEEAGLLKKGDVSLFFSSAKVGAANGATKPANMCSASTTLSGPLGTQAESIGSYIGSRYGLQPGQTGMGQVRMASRDLEILIWHPLQHPVGINVTVTSMSAKTQ